VQTQNTESLLQVNRGTPSAILTNTAGESRRRIILATCYVDENQSIGSLNHVDFTEIFLSDLNQCLRID